MNILSSFAPSSCSKPVWLHFFFLEHRRRYLKKIHSLMCVCVFSELLFLTFTEQTTWVTFFKKWLFMFHRRKKLIQVLNNMRVNKWQNFHFGMNYPFNILSLLNTHCLFPHSNMHSGPKEMLSISAGHTCSVAFRLCALTLTLAQYVHTHTLVSDASHFSPITTSHTSPTAF